MRKNVKSKATKKGDNTIQPIGDKVLVKPLEENTGSKLPSGIIIPDTIEEKKTDRGTVIAVGEGKYDDNGNLIPMNVRKGDKVMFQWGDKVEYRGEEYFIVGEGNILAIIK